MKPAVLFCLTFSVGSDEPHHHAERYVVWSLVHQIAQSPDLWPCAEVKRLGKGPHFYVTVGIGGVGRFL